MTARLAAVTEQRLVLAHAWAGLVGHGDTPEAREAALSVVQEALVLALMVDTDHGAIDLVQRAYRQAQVLGAVDPDPEP